MKRDTNAARQRRYIKRLKERADTPHASHTIMRALEMLKPNDLEPIEHRQFYAEQLIKHAIRLWPSVLKDRQ
jgi:hypothetical protein